MLHGEPEVSLGADINPNCQVCGTPALRDALEAQLNAAIETERQDFQNDISDFKIWPVISFGVTYSF